MKTDTRVRYTKHIIREVFLNILKEKPLGKITVKEICDKAEINRGTFYKHYEDIYDLMNQLEDEALAQFESILNESSETDTKQILEYLLTTLVHYKEYIYPLWNHTEAEPFLNRLTQICSKYALSSMTDSDFDFTKNPEKKFLYSYIAGGTGNMIRQWLDDGTAETPKMIAEMITRFNALLLSQSNTP